MTDGQCNEMKSCKKISKSRKLLLRNSAESKINACAKTEFSVQAPSASDESEVYANVLKESNHSSSDPDACLYFKNNVPESSRLFNHSQDSSTTVDPGAHDKASKRLNIPFNEVVYQDLISLSETRVKIKPSEMMIVSEKPRRFKNLDPEPEARNFFHHVKQEFVFCDLVGKSMDPNVEDIDNSSQSYFKKARDSSDHVNNDCMCNEDSDHASVNEGRVCGNGEGDMNCVERLKILHENYGLDPPQLKSYFEGSTLHKRSQAWKMNLN